MISAARRAMDPTNKDLDRVCVAGQELTNRLSAVRFHLLNCAKGVVIATTFRHDVGG